MRMIERLGLETEEHHPKADEDALQLLGPATPADYRRFLMRTFSFVAPVERSIANVRGLDRLIDTRRFTKADMIRRDLTAFRMPSAEIDRIALCTVPMFNSPEEALGWVYPIERSMLGHSNLFRHLASLMPGDVAFTSTYLKCYFGVVGESWKSYSDALQAVGDSDTSAQRIIESARTSFRTHRSWRDLQEEQMLSANDGGSCEQRRA